MPKREDVTFRGFHMYSIELYTKAQRANSGRGDKVSLGPSYIPIQIKEEILEVNHKIY